MELLEVNTVKEICRNNGTTEINEYSVTGNNKSTVDNDLLINLNPVIASLLENVPDVIGIISAEGIIKYKSPNITKWFGWQPSELIGTDAWETVFFEDIPKIKKEFYSILGTKNEPRTIEYRYKCKNGSYKWIELTAVNKVDDPDIGGILLNYHDIMHFKATEKALQDSIQTAIDIIDSIPSGLYVYQFIAPDKLFLLNGNYESEILTGLKMSDIRGREFNDIWPNAKQAGLTDKYLNVAYSGKLLDIEEFNYKDDKLEGIFRIKAFKMPGNKLGVAFENVTKQYLAQDELTDQKTFFEQVFSQSSISTQILDKDGWCLRINPKLTELFGVQPSEIEGKVYNIFRDEGIRQGGVLPHLEKVFFEGKTADWEVYFDIGVAAESQNIKVKEKKKVWFQNWAFPVFDRSGNISHVIIQHTDITNRKNAEAALKDSELKFRTVADYAYNWNYLENTNKEIVYMSPSCLRITGYSKEEFIGDPSLLRKIVHEDDLEKFDEHVKHVILQSDEVTFCELEYKIIKKDGSCAYISHICMPIIDEKKEYQGRRISNRDITERKIAREELLKSEQKYRQLFENMDSAFALHKIITDNKGIPIDYLFIEVNSKFEEMTGINKSELIGKKVLDILPRTEKSWIDRYGKVALTGESESFTDFSAELNKYYDVRAFSPEIGYFAVTFNDVTDRKAWEKRLRDSESRLKLAADSASLGIWYMNLETEEVVWDQLMYEIFGREKNGEMTYSKVMESIFPDDRVHVKSVIENAINNYDTFHMDYRILLFDGTVRFIESHGIIELNNDGNPYSVIGISRDITINKLHEKDLLESKNQLKLIFDNSPSIMLLVNENEEIIRINKPGLVVANKAEEEVIGIKGGYALNCAHVLDDERGCGFGMKCKECIIRNTVQDTINTNTDHYKVETVLNTILNGKLTEFTVLVSSSIASLAPQKSILVTIDNITERKRLENDLVIAKNKAEESDRLKTAFLQNMSHEIRTPLNGILGFSGLLEDCQIPEDDKMEYIDVIKKSGQRLLEIVNNTLDISKLETGQLVFHNSIVSLKQLMKKLYEDNYLNVRQKGLALECFINNKYGNIQLNTDKERLYQVINNLINNAVKFTIAGTIEYGYRVDNNKIEIFVSDTGIGIPKEYHEKIFDRFVQADLSITRNYEGAGLGLAICKGLVELMGGSITVKSHSGKGSCFYVSLPYNHPVSNLKSILPENSKMQINTSLNILVAEDDLVSFDFLRIGLRKMGYNVIHAANGVEAIEICNSTQKVDIILMDIKMPVMNGIEASGIIRRNNPDISIVAQTSYSDENNNYLKYDNLFDGYIVKPINFNELSKILFSVFSAKEKQYS